MVIKGIHKDPKGKAKKKKLKSIAKLKKELWTHFTLFIKNRDGWKCFTCGRSVEGSGAHGGHFVTKSIGGIELYFNESNVNCQCYNCNINLSGNIWEYGSRLGAEKVQELLSLKESSRKAQWDRKKFEEMIEKYKWK